MERNAPAVLLVLLTFFVISFITNVFGPIFPALVADFRVSLGLAGMFPFAFFLAYGCLSIPAGMLVHRYGEKRVMLIAFGMAACGSAAFALLPTFGSAMASLFLIGAGMALLQVAINPLLRVAGGEANFAFYSVLAQLVFGAAAAASPLVYSAIVTRHDASTTMPWLAMYALFALLCAGMVALIALLRLPAVRRTEQESVGAWQVHRELLTDPVVRRYAFGIVAYVFTEQGVANSISVFLQRYHGIDPQTGGAAVVSGFWIAMTIGCAAGLVLLKLFDSRRVLLAFVFAAVACLVVALPGDARIAIAAFHGIGFSLSVMFSVIFSLALNSVERHHGSFSGILCTGIVGGAIASPIVGTIADVSGSLRIGMLVLLVSLGYIAYVAMRARPIIANATIRVARADAHARRAG